MGNVGSSNLTARPKTSNNEIGGASSGGTGSGSVTPGNPFIINKQYSHQESQDDDDNLPYYTAGTGISSGGRHSTSEPQSPITTTAPFTTEDTMTSSLSRPKSSSDGLSSSIQPILLDKKTLPTVFRWSGGASKQVYISGTFSNWRPIPMTKSHHDFVTIIDLPEGDHQYKFMVDGEWKYDTKLKNIETDSGAKNNLVSVKQSDFEVFQALAKDSENCSSQAQKDYSQNIPDLTKPWEKITGPPVLPPHLLQVILNKDTPLSCEPTLLPEPNHVMLNHLYALSIKDGVMVLSATHRYRKKYVTTLLYKPI